MPRGLDLIILDDDKQSLDVLERMISSFYTGGKVYAFDDFLEARHFCFKRESAVALFVLDVYLGEHDAFEFVENLKVHYPMISEDSIVITGNASEEVIDKCMAAGINHLLEKPIRFFALQFAVRAVAGKYLRFAQKLMQDQAFAQSVNGLETRQ